MADRRAGEILIGGRIPRRLLEDLLDAMSAQFVGLDWGGVPFSPASEEDLLAGCVDHEGVTVLRLCHDEARDGAFETLEAFLCEHRIPFDRFSDGRYEYDPEWAFFRPDTGLQFFTTNTSRKRVYDESSLTAVVDQLERTLGQLKAGRIKGAITLVTCIRRELVSELSSGCEGLPPFQLFGRPAPLEAAV